MAINMFYQKEKQANTLTHETAQKKKKG